MSYKKQITQIKQLLNELEIDLALTKVPELEQIRVSNLADLGQMLNQKRKALGIDLHTLTLQTDLSTSTLKRLFSDPSQVKFSSVVLVAEILGVELCYVK